MRCSTTTAHFLLREQRAELAVASAVLCVLSLLRFYDQRWKLTELTYATAVIVHETKSGHVGEPAPRTAALQDD